MAVRVALVSDTHLPRGRRALQPALLERCAAADLVLHVGDLVEQAVLDQLQQLGPPVQAVLGNADRGALRDVLPDHLDLDLDGARVAVVHDAGPRQGRRARMARRFPDADAVVFGHSHIPLCDAGERPVLFNPGSATDKRREPVHTMGWCVADGGALRFEHLELESPIAA